MSEGHPVGAKTRPSLLFTAVWLRVGGRIVATRTDIDGRTVRDAVAQEGNAPDVRSAATRAVAEGDGAEVAEDETNHQTGEDGHQGLTAGGEAEDDCCGHDDEGQRTKCRHGRLFENAGLDFFLVEELGGPTVAAEESEGRHVDGGSLWVPEEVGGSAAAEETMPGCADESRVTLGEIRVDDGLVGHVAHHKAASGTGQELCGTGADGDEEDGGVRQDDGQDDETGHQGLGQNLEVVHDGRADVICGTRHSPYCGWLKPVDRCLCKGSMGIPSFYRQLLRQYPKLVSRGLGSRRPEWLCLDFNCAMYHVLRKQPPFPGSDSDSGSTSSAWETHFCEEIAAYMEKLVVLARPTKGVYVSCDGVVCAAKRRQQRMRRFKGPWFSAAEREVRRQAGSTASSAQVGVTWDQNALTPGSAFMAKLGIILTKAGARVAARQQLAVTVSTTSEPGEGEHKLLAAMRSLTPASCMIYGLDADLILLSMLLGAETGAEVRLLREAQEFESRSDADEWRTLDVRGLADVMLPGASPAQVTDFVAAMSLLGNDFLPRSLTRTVRDDGIPQLLAGLREWVWPAGHRIVVAADGSLSRDGLMALLGSWAAAEENDLLATALDGVRAARRPAGIGANPEETALKEWQASPARWCAIAQLLTTPDSKQLSPHWRATYCEDWHAGGVGAAAEYLQGLAWVSAYYSGAAVDQGWYYESHLPPLWSDVVTALAAMPAGSVVSPPPVVWAKPLPEWLHLLSVLPVASVRRLLPADRQGLMVAEPWWWPDSWSLFDVGRGQMWECEPVIPMIPEEVLRVQSQVTMA